MYCLIVFIRESELTSQKRMKKTNQVSLSFLRLHSPNKVLAFSPNKKQKAKSQPKSMCCSIHMGMEGVLLDTWYVVMVVFSALTLSARRTLKVRGKGH